MSKLSCAVAALAIFAVAASGVADAQFPGQPGPEDPVHPVHWAGWDELTGFECPDAVDSGKLTLDPGFEFFCGVYDPGDLLYDMNQPVGPMVVLLVNIGGNQQPPVAADTMTATYHGLRSDTGWFWFGSRDYRLMQNGCGYDTEPHINFFTGLPSQMSFTHEIRMSDEDDWVIIKDLCDAATPYYVVNTWYAVTVEAGRSFDYRVTAVDASLPPPNEHLRDGLTSGLNFGLLHLQRAERPVSSEGALVDASPLVLYPNPARSRARVQGLELGDSWSIQDALGRELAAGAGAELPADRLSSGTYVVRVTRRDGRVQTKRLTVTR